MASRRSRPRRLLLPTVLAAVLAAEITGLALARTFVPAASTPSGPLAAVGAAPAGTATGDRAGPADGTDLGRDDRGDVPEFRATRPAEQVRSAVATKPRTTGRGGHTPDQASRSYEGRNHVWIPSLGITRTVQSFPCSRSRPPDAGVYRWGCAGHNNVYLLGHAWSTFKPLHDAYVSGRLHAGMKVIYADGAGTVHTYSVAWWKVVAPTTAASWAWASLSRPSMTLQTCVGANSAYRLMVRLVRVG
jgi:hypothetical protein